MNLRLLTGLAVVPLILAMLTAGPAGAVSGPHPDKDARGGSAAEVGEPVAVEMAAEVSEPPKQAADSVALLAGVLVVAASAAFAGTGMVRRRKIRR
jgi:hypothetical protein